MLDIIYPLLLSATKNNPERAHQRLLDTLAWVDRSRNQPWFYLIVKQLENSFRKSDTRLSQQLWGLDFPNPVGLAPGCDKDGIAAGMWSSFGFGFAELGAVTWHSQPGNPQPRLFRLSPDLAVLNRLGANNLGAAVMAETLEQAWKRQPRQIPIGINLCKSKVTSLEDAAKDYLGSFEALKKQADYFTVNVSSPNTPGLRNLQGGEELEGIFSLLQENNPDKLPMFVKIAPDLDWEAIALIVDLAQAYELAGVIATNTTVKREGLKTEILEGTGKPVREEAGGISGLPLKQRSTEVIRFIYQHTGGKLPIIGVGGIFSAEDAWEKITAGACLVQLYTGWIYQGPQLISRIVAGLGKKLEEKGLNNISQAVGYQD